MDLAVRPKRLLANVSTTKGWKSAKALHHDQSPASAYARDTSSLTNEQQSEYDRLWDQLQNNAAVEIQAQILGHFSDAKLSDIYMVAQKMSDRPTEHTNPQYRYLRLLNILGFVDHHRNPMLVYCYKTLRHAEINVHDHRKIIQKLHDEPYHHFLKELSMPSEFSKYLPFTMQHISKDHNSVHMLMTKSIADAWFMLPKFAHMRHRLSMLNIANEHQIRTELDKKLESYRSILQTDGSATDIYQLSSRNDLGADEYLALIKHHNTADSNLKMLLNTIIQQRSTGSISEIEYQEMREEIALHHRLVPAESRQNLIWCFAERIRDRELRAKVMQRSDLPGLKYLPFMTKALDTEEQLWILSRTDMNAREIALMAVTSGKLDPQIFDKLVNHVRFDAEALQHVTEHRISDELFHRILARRDLPDTAIRNMIHHSTEYSRRSILLQKYGNYYEMGYHFLMGASDSRELQALLQLKVFSLEHVKTYHAISSGIGSEKAKVQYAALELLSKLAPQEGNNAKEIRKTIKNKFQELKSFCFRNKIKIDSKNRYLVEELKVALLGVPGA